MKITKESLKAMITPVQAGLPELPADMDASERIKLSSIDSSEFAELMGAHASAPSMDTAWAVLQYADKRMHAIMAQRFALARAAIAQHVSATPGDPDLRFSFELAARKGFDHTMRGIDFQRNDDDEYKWAVTRNLYEFWKTACGIKAAARTPAAPVADLHAVRDGICGPLTDTQRNELRHLYRNLHHLGPDAMEDVVRQASVCGYVNGRRDFGDARHAAAELVASHAPSVPVANVERELIEAAKAVVARWYSPKKDGPSTVMFIDRLRDALRLAAAPKESDNG